MSIVWAVSSPQESIMPRCEEVQRIELTSHQLAQQVIAIIDEIKQNKYLDSSLYPDIRDCYVRLQVKLGIFYYEQEQFQEALDCYNEATKYSEKSYEKEISEIKQQVATQRPNLPLKKYRQMLGNSPNSQGYWEIELKGHTMIYIPKSTTGPGGFFVDKYEVSYAQLETVDEFKNKRQNANRPFIRAFGPQFPALVSFDEAERYCKAKGFRLLTAQEWEWIAGKNFNFTYSWGNQEVDSGGSYRANYDEPQKDGFVTAAPVYAFSNYLSPFGVYNLSGNVWEWVQGRVCKGGGFLSKKEELKITSSSKDQPFVGFRCAKDE